MLDYELTIDEIKDAAYYGAGSEETLRELAERVRRFIEAREEADDDRLVAEIAHCYIVRELDSTRY